MYWFVKEALHFLLETVDFKVHVPLDDLEIAIQEFCSESSRMDEKVVICLEML